MRWASPERRSSRRSPWTAASCGRAHCSPLFPGTTVDGARFIPAAVEKGAVAVLCEAGVAETVPDGVARLVSDDPREAFARIAGRFYRARPDTMVAVTGTNGKTSVAAFVQQIWQATGQASATMGTLGITHPDSSVTPSLTTPDTVTLHEALAELAGAGVEAVALEASSHGLAQHRLDGVPLNAAAFTNITRDHLDYHATPADYLAAKMHIFSLLAEGGRGVVDADGDGSPGVIASLRARGFAPITVGRAGENIVLRGREGRRHDAGSRNRGLRADL